MEIYLIRHTKPFIEKGICYGQSDIDVLETFNEESKKLIQWLPKDIDILYSSPLKRCLMLSQKIQNAMVLKPDIVTDKRIIEMNFGDWEMKKWEEIDREESDTWIRNILTQSTPNGESFNTLNMRVTSFIDEIIVKKQKRIGVITHAGVIRCFKSYFSKTPLIDTLKTDIDFASLTILNSDSLRLNLPIL